ncbi:ABC transporter ATP-binding protein [Brevibacterium ihuae]|uniref:ABC transporter ATP-binding protein n=1 Tax=Brevibacterium ihuae TaxID=1631743 RepID=UPI000C77DCF6|nr:ABC transporter ATP-binding protein [Brevibacterium ihuae]
MSDTHTAATRAPVLSVRDLSVRFWVGGEWFTAAEDLDYDVHPGEVLAIVGESGSGKSQSSMSLIGLLPANGRASGSARLGDRELIGMPQSHMRGVRGRDISIIFQEPMTALNPVYTVGYQIVETLRTHFDMGPSAAKERALELMRLVEIPEPEKRFDSFPHQLSGGQRQRIMIAQALACDPKLLIADEPTTALDVTVQAEILKLMRDLRERIDSGIILITHDMGVVADMADRILVMRNGRVVESGTSAEIFGNPQHPYTRQLLASVPHLGANLSGGALGGVDLDAVSADPEHAVVGSEAVADDGATGPDEDAGTREITLDSTEMLVHPGGRWEGGGTPALRLDGASIEYPASGRQKAFRAAHRIDMEIGAGEVVGLVGESGSGKTTIGRAALGLLPVVEGSIEVVGTDITGMKNSQLRKHRRDVGIVFQDPGSSLNPRLPVGESIGEPLLLHEGLKGPELSRRVEDLLDSVELPRSMRNRYPHELSGGQRQRIGIARALALKPKLLIADEPTSALDVSVQAKVLRLFSELQEEYGFACLFISHDLAVVESVAARIAVMRHGHIVEIGPSSAVISAPLHPYTRRLLAAVPVPDPEEQRRRRETRDAVIAATTE